MKNTKIFKKKVLSVLSAGIILTSFVGCSLDEDMSSDKENIKQDSTTMMTMDEPEKNDEESTSNPKEKSSEEGADENNNTTKEVVGFSGLTLTMGAIIALAVYEQERKRKFYDAALGLDNKAELVNNQKTYHK